MFRKVMEKLALAGGLVTVSATSAMAEFTLPTLPVTDIEAAGTAVAALVVAAPNVYPDQATAGQQRSGDHQHHATPTADVQEGLVTLELELGQQATPAGELAVQRRAQVDNGLGEQ